MAISIGAYDDLIGAVNNVRKDWKKSFITLLPYGIGMVLGIGLLSFVIESAMKIILLSQPVCFLG